MESRRTLYMIAQTIGSAIAGGLLLGVWGYERSVRSFGGGCFLDPTHVTYGQAFLNEFFSSFVLLFLAYGVGLDPRQAALFGPRLGPLLVGVSLRLVTFATSGTAPGYAGAQINPGRCFAPVDLVGWTSGGSRYDRGSVQPGTTTPRRLRGKYEGGAVATAQVVACADGELGGVRGGCDWWWRGS
ncbi:hypothetical protein MAPG_11684 [Magnaporthiopsis poae ATCC 64411]|uniref:Aquaporin n=1 Tax=Magnaporthiopsis poae (strain ATCC 64411 / 73-15) TaxID=644358 RepID=A0A0C4EFX4_MAGP6|nr:hypothetical protein MAPG_11684 [Magnaporthiopsis poae ATCC 64411]